MKKQLFGLITGVVVVFALARLLPHPYNFTPVAAMAIFAGSQYSKKIYAFSITIIAMFLSDILVMKVLYPAYDLAGYFLSFSTLMVYVSLLMINLIGRKLQNNTKLQNLIAASLASSLLFFLLTNFGAWLGNPLYTQDFSGLLAAYIAGIPFIQFTILGDLFYTMLIFGLYRLLVLSFVNDAKTT